MPIPAPAVADGAGVPGAGPDEGEDDANTRRDLKKEAISTRHLLTHTPYNKYCEACKSAKMKEKKHFVGSFKREVKKWGEVLTADHLVGRKSARLDQMLGCTGEQNAMNVKDLWSKLVACYPVKDK